MSHPQLPAPISTDPIDAVDAIMKRLRDDVLTAEGVVTQETEQALIRAEIAVKSLLIRSAVESSPHRLVGITRSSS